MTCAVDHDSRVVTLVEQRGRPIGAYVADAGTVRFVPVVDVNRLAYATLTGLAVSTVAVAFGARRRAAIGSVTMGPGGWISLKNAGLTGLRPTPGRPWWARLLRAHRLVVDHR